MHANSAQMLAMANSLWPFAYSLKSYDLSLHPAFLSSAYRGFPALPTSTYPQSIGQPLSTSPQSNKSDKFSIDAILGKDDKRPSSTESSTTEDIHKLSPVYGDSEKVKEAALSRRHQRLFEASHPYLSHTNAFTDLHQQTTGQAALGYRRLSDAQRAQVSDKSEKKSVGGGQVSWGKHGKGKRVRTIFTPEQLERMEAEFERQQYMVGTERYYLASSLNLTEAQVKVWFQNRRIKWRKQHLEQQKAKLNCIDIYNQAESGSDSESDDEINRSNDVISNHVTSFADPFQSPREIRSTQ